MEYQTKAQMGSMLALKRDAVSATRNSIKNTLVNIHDDINSIQKAKPLISHKGGLPLLYDLNDIYVDASDSPSLIIGSTGSKKTR